MIDLKSKYREEVIPAMIKARGYSNPFQAPKLLKIVVSMGFKSSYDKDVIKILTKDLTMLTGQAPMLTKARKSVSNFKLRSGMTIGAKVTLRGERMYDFLARFIHVVLPRIRDFRGVPAGGFDGRGAYSMGVTEQTIFPEIDPDSVRQAQGMNITMVTNAKSDEEAHELLKLIGIPFAEAESQKN